MTKFRMFGIHLDQFAILCEDCKDEVGMNVSLNFKYGDEGKKVACVVAFDFTSESEKVMVLKMTCEFEIQVDDWKTLRNDKEVVIPKDLLEFSQFTRLEQREVFYSVKQKTLSSTISLSHQ